MNVKEKINQQENKLVSDAGEQIGGIIQSFNDLYNTRVLSGPVEILGNEIPGKQLPIINGDVEPYEFG